MNGAVNANFQKISIKADTFETFCNDFDSIMNQTLDNMREKDLDEAEITIKMTVKANKRQVEAPTAANLNEKRTAIVPTFTHKMVTVYKVENKVEGQLANGYELIYDEETGEYILVEISTAQTSMFGSGGQMEYYEAEGEVSDAADALPPPQTYLPEPEEKQDDGEAA